MGGWGFFLFFYFLASTQEVTLALKGVTKIPAAAVHPEWSSPAKSGERVLCQGTY